MYNTNLSRRFWSPGFVFSFGICRAPFGFALALALLALISSGQDVRLSRDQFRSGDEMLRAFAPVSAMTRNSVVKFNVDGKTVALGAVVDTNGLALTKASELKKGKLTCWLANDKEVPAELISTDD